MSAGEIVDLRESDGGNLKVFILTTGAKNQRGQKRQKNQDNITNKTLRSPELYTYGRCDATDLHQVDIKVTVYWLQEHISANWTMFEAASV